MDGHNGIMQSERGGNAQEPSALVLEGGAMRGIFSTGVLDAFLKASFNPFDMCVGVSAGANNLVSFLGGAYKRNYSIYTDLSVRPEFISISRFLSGGHLLDIDWLWDASMRELPVDLEAVVGSEHEYYVGLTRVSDGQAVQVKPDFETLGSTLKASSAMPLFYRNFVALPGVDADCLHFVDGGLADPIPVHGPYSRGARRIMVLRSRPNSYVMKPKRFYKLLQWSLQDYPGLIECLHARAWRYNDTLSFIRHPPEDTEIMEVNPPEEFETSRMTRDVDRLDRDYARGLEAGETAMEEWKLRFG